MSLLKKASALRNELAGLAAAPEWDLLVRHDLLAKKEPASLQARIWRRIRSWMASVGLLRPHVTPYAWLPTLKHSPRAEGAKTLLIWAPDVGRDELRRFCHGFAARLDGDLGWAPLLVTDVADFAFYSRLGWLVEYLPELSGEGTAYAERKRRYLAWRYRDACVVSADAGLANDEEWQALLKVDKK